ncbi:MAG: retropepsin-like aspartic protease [Pseudomonadota bacterium]
MRSIHGSLSFLQPLIQVSIGPFGGAFGDRETCTALIDTGATRTCLTPRLIQKFGLQPKSKLLVSSATSAPERRRAYSYSLGLFCNEGAAGLQTLYVLPYEFIAPPFIDNDNFDVLLGMDILSQGRLVFEADGSFLFDFTF